MTKTLSICCILTLLFTSELCGQSADNLDTAGFSIELEDLVVTAQYAPTDRKNSIHRVQVIQKDQIAKRGNVRLDELLQLESGIRIKSDQILGSSITIQGIESANVMILRDGIPVLGRLNGNIDLSQISLHNVERIEIIQGPVSTLYGNNAAGGVINIISKKSSLNNVDVKITSQLESTGISDQALGINFKHKKLNVGGSYRVFDDKPYSIDSTRIRETVTDINDVEYVRDKYPLNLKDLQNWEAYFSYDVSNNNTMRLSVSRDAEQVSNPGEIRRPQFRPYAYDELYTTKRNSQTLFYDGESKKHFYNLSVSRSTFERKYARNYYDVEGDSINLQKSNEDTTNFEAYYGRLSMARGYQKGLSFIIGSQFNYETGSGDKVMDDDDDPERVVSNEFALFGELRYKIVDNLTLSASARGTKHNLYGLDISPGFKLLHKPIDKLQVRGGWSQGFRSPTLKENYLEFVDVNHHVLGNKDLQAEKSRNIFVDAEFNTKHKEIEIMATTTLFSNKVKDRIILAELEAGTLKFNYQNIGTYSTFGGGAGVNMRYRGLSFNSDITQTYWYNELSQNTDVKAYTPTTDFSNQLSYSFKKPSITLSIYQRHVGSTSRFIVVEDVLYEGISDSYDLIDFSISSDIWKKKIQLTAGVKNALNVNYINTPATANGPNIHLGSSSQLVNRGRSFFVRVQMALSSKFDTK